MIFGIVVKDPSSRVNSDPVSSATLFAKGCNYTAIFTNAMSVYVL